MAGYRNLMLRSAMAALVLLSVSCVHKVSLRSPRNADSLEVGGNAGPQFAWRSSYTIRRPGDYQEFFLTVASDRSFRDVLFKSKKLESRTFMIDPEEAWLPGGKDAKYFWKVEGVVRDQDAGERVYLPCEKIRSFSLARRQTVQVVMTVPKGFEAQISGSGREFSTGVISASIENGERREVTIKSVPSFEPAGDGAQDGAEDGPKERIVVSGHIWVITVNDNTKYGKIAINNLEPEKLALIAKGDVGDYSYELGGERIIEMKLGGKSLSSD